MNNDITIVFSPEELKVLHYALKTVPLNALTPQQRDLLDGLLLTVGFGEISG